LKATLEIQIGSVTRDGEPVANDCREQAAQIVCGVFAQRYGGWYEEQRIGGWLDDHANLVREESLWVCCCAEDDENTLRVLAEELGEYVAQQLNQDCTMYRIVPCEYGFVEQGAKV